MTNEDVVRKIKSNMEYRKSWSMVHHDTLNTCISQLEENTKLKDEIEQLKEELEKSDITRNKQIYVLLQVIEQLKSELKHATNLIPKMCENCEYEDEIGWIEPCNSCNNRNNWKMKGQVKHESN